MLFPSYYQILDSRGNPTVKGSIHIDGSLLQAAVPSGASTGIHEAKELRDQGDTYAGKSVLQAVENAHTLSTRINWEQADLKTADAYMKKEDGTPDKSHMGANAMLCVSMLQACVEAKQKNLPLYRYLNAFVEWEPALPVPFANILNGGKHAGTKLQLQEFMIVPIAATSFYEATQHVVETYQILKDILQKRYGKGSTGLGDEGGFAPNISADEALELLKEAADASGHKLGFALDAAASEFFADGMYEIEKGKKITAEELRDWYVEKAQQYPIVSIEDPFDQDDFGSFAALRQALESLDIKCQVVGDDLTVSNTDRIKTAASQRACSCLLLKINQIGLVTEAIEAANTAFAADWQVMVSHRSGETTDTFIADLATGLGTGQIKLGAPARGERTAKYNRLLELEILHKLPLKQLHL